MAELENNAYQDEVTEKKVAPLTSFLEGVQSRGGLGKNAVRDRFDPYTRNRNKKDVSLTDTLMNIQMMREADEDDLEDELSDVGDIETDADESPDEDDGVPAETEVSDTDIDNEVAPEEGRIVGEDGDGDVVDGIFIGPGQRYFMGASTDPQMVIVSKISEDYVWYNSFPFKKAEKLKKEIAGDLFKTGSQTWLKDPKSKTEEDLRTSIESILNGRPGERVSLDDYQYSSIQVKYTGEASGDLEPWKELESGFDIVVDSNLTNKQTYNIRMNNKELENFRSSLQENPVSERNFKIIRIVTESREYMLESANNPMPKPVTRDLEEFEKDEYRLTLIKNSAAGYGSGDYAAGQRVIYNSEIWMIMDFVPFGEDMTLILINEDNDKVAEFVKIKDVKPLKDDPNEELKAAAYGSKADKIKKNKKPKGAWGGDAQGKAVDITPKDKKIDLPVSDLASGETQKQKELKEEKDLIAFFTEEIDSEKKTGVLVEFIKKDAELNKNRLTPINANLQRKRREGSYDSDLAGKAFRVLVDEGASKYFNENDGKIAGEEFSSHREMFPTEVRTNVSGDFRDEFEANVEMGNMDESLSLKIDQLILEADQIIEDEKVEGIVFTPAEVREFQKFDSVDISAENIATYSWDVGTNSFRVNITKKPREATNDIVYSSVSTEGGEDLIDDKRTKDSESFKTQEDLPILRDFLTNLSLNEEGKVEDEDVSASDVHPEQLMMGIKVEMEHTDDREEAKKIALDHLAEFGDYYTRHAKMEKKAEKETKKEEITEDEGDDKKSKTPVKKDLRTTIKMVNALPVRDGKKIRTEVKGDLRIRYKTFEEKRKDDLKRKSEPKKEK